MSENKLTGSLGVRNEINVDIIGTGARGKEGKSAYEIWLDLGNEGTEQEFLESLKGQDGHTPVKGEDYFDGQDGAPGADGITPHIGVNGNWHLGETDTGVKAEGKDGKDGAKGDKGDDGHTPIKGTDYWTTADQASIVADVLAALPNGDGVSY
jgi:hypothetical protein